MADPGEKRRRRLHLDALLDAQPRRELDQSELAERVVVYRQSVRPHLDLILDTEMLEQVVKKSRQWHRFTPASTVNEAIIHRDAAMNTG